MLLLMVDPKFDEVERRGRERGQDLVERLVDMGAPVPNLVERRPADHSALWPRMAVAFAVVAAALLLLLRPDPLLLARRLGGGGNGVRPRRATGVALRAVWGSPAGRLGITAVIVAHSVMVGIMVMTPVHMGHAGGPEGTTLRVIGLVISVHVAGMYLFSPLVGILADRAGRTATVALPSPSARKAWIGRSTWVIGVAEPK